MEKIRKFGLAVTIRTACLRRKSPDRQAGDISNPMGKRAKKKPDRTPWQWPFLYYFLTGSCILVLPLITSKAAMDISLIPRMTALLAFLLLPALFFLHGNTFRQLDTALLKDPVFAIYGGYLLVTLLSLAFAVNPSAGYFDAFKTFAVLVLMAFAVLLLMKQPGWEVSLTRLFILSSLLVFTIGFTEMVRELGFGFHPRNQINTVRGLMSNVNLYASSLMLLVPWAAFGLAGLRRQWRWLSAASLALLLFMIFLLQTRAAYVGLLGGLLAAVAVLFILPDAFGMGRRTRNRIGLAMLGGAAVFVILLLAAGEENIYARRFLSIFSGEANQNRLMIWDLSLRLFRDNPLTGAGAGNFTIGVQEYYAAYEFPGGPTNYLRPHNDLLWVASEKGIPGLLFYGAFALLPLAYAIQIIRGQGTASRKYLALFLLMGIVSYHVNSLFDFPLERINHQAGLAFMVAALVVLRHQEGHREAGPLRWRRIPVVLPIIAVLLLGLQFSLQAIRQERHVTEARKAWITEDWEAMLREARKAATPWKTLDQLATPVAFMEGVALAKMDRTAEALVKMELAHKHNPNRLYVLYNLGTLYTRLGDYEKGIETFTRTLSMYPGHLGTLTNLSVCYLNTGQQAGALETLERIPEEMRSEAVKRNIILLKRQLQEP